MVPYPYLAGLNPRQREAVETLDGPVLVLAGAGTGKTRVLTTRLAHLIVTGRVRPWQVLAVTFTNKAAREMRERVAQMLGHVEERWWIGTFHSTAARILRERAELVGLKSGFTILDTDDQIRLLKQLIDAEGIDEKKNPARTLLAVINRWKDRGLTPDKVTPTEDVDFANGRALQLYRAYQERLKVLNACDFGDLMLHTLTILQTHPDVLAAMHRRWPYILVDEYQDTNVCQYLWLRLLAQGHRNLCCVGDDDQSVYGWRGAEVGNILRFETDFPGAAVIRLEQNYRSTSHILAAASGLIAHNEGRLGKTLWTETDGGEAITVRGVWDGDEEARAVGEMIEDFRDGRQGPANPAALRISLGATAILVRAGFQTRAFEERFITIGLPYRVVGGPRFYERLEIRDALAYMRVIAQPSDDLAFERIVNTPKRGIGDSTLAVVHRLARAESIPLVDAVQLLIATDEIKPAARTKLAKLLESFSRWRAMLHGDPVTLAETVLEESGYTDFWQDELRKGKPEAGTRLDNLKELINALDAFETVFEFLEHVSLVMDQAEGNPEEQVTIMTLHGAKGLEFDTVFLPGWEEGVFPSQRSLDENGMKGLEEERRLAYVGITRAKRKAVILHAATRRIHGMWNASIPSRFVTELPAETVETLTDTTGPYGPADSGRWGTYGSVGGGGSGMGGSGGRIGRGDFRDGFRNASAFPAASGGHLGGSGQVGGPGLHRAMRRGMSESGADGPVIDGEIVGRPHSSDRDARAAAGLFQPGGEHPARGGPRSDAANEGGFYGIATSRFEIGSRVFHQKFGYGEVMVAEGEKLVIDFDHAGEKHVMARFVVAADDAG